MVTVEANTLEEGLVKVAQLLGSDILSQSKLNLQESETIDTGQLLQSGELILRSDGATVRYGINYADFVEYGTDPHWTPIEPLIEWARRKGMDEGFAFAVQKKIAKFGTDPNPYARNAVDQVIKKYSG